MKNYEIKKQGVCGVISFGVKNPEADTHRSLRETNHKYQYENNGNLESFTVPFEGGTCIILDIMNYINDRFKLEGVIGYAVGKNIEQIETTLGRVMSAAGAFQTAKEECEGTPIFDMAVGKLEKMMDSYDVANNQEE